MIRLYLIRHGESHVNLGNWDKLDTMDTGLTERGHTQAEALRKWLVETDAEGDVLYASTMRRAQETAHYVERALGLTIQLDDRLREIGSNYGDGRPIEENLLPRKFTESHGATFPFLSRSDDLLNVESWMHLRLRVAQFLDDVIRQHENKVVYVVAHGGVISATIQNVTNIGAYRQIDIHSDNTGITYLEYDKDFAAPWYLRYLNRVDHLVWRGDEA